MSRTPRRLAIGLAGLWALSIPPGPAGALAAAEPTGDRAVVPAALAPRRDPVPLEARRPVGAISRGDAGAGWWLGPVGIAAAFAVVGAASLASRRFHLNLGAGGAAGPIAVIGQARLAPKHAVHLVRVGGRVLVLGTGPGGAPTALGEVTDPGELARLVPARMAASSSSAGRPAAPARPAPDLGRPGGFDRRIGDDE